MAELKQRIIQAEERRRRPVSIGMLADESIDVFCWCNRCGHNATVAIAQLIAELGPELPEPEIGPRMRCTGCGSKDIATRPAWPSLGQVARHG